MQQTLSRRRAGRERPTTPAELNIELESRDAYSAVALGFEHGGGLASQECYRSLSPCLRMKLENVVHKAYLPYTYTTRILRSTHTHSHMHGGMYPCTSSKRGLCGGAGV